MSIKAAIKRHVRNGRLFPLEMSLESDRVLRGLFLSSEMKKLMEGPWTSAQCGSRVSRLQADFESYAKGESIVMSLEPFAAEDATFGRLDAPDDEVWDLRSRDPSPGLRVFGRFAAPNVFIAFDWYPRSRNWNGKQPLGDRHHQLWEIAKRNCQEQWSNLFPNYEALNGDQVQDYVTENAFSLGSP